MTRPHRERTQKIRNTLNFLCVIASIILIVSVSLEAFSDDPFMAHSVYFDTQFWICIYFTTDFFVFLALAENRWRFFKRYFAVLLLSIPYLPLIEGADVQLTVGQTYFLHLIPLARGAAALVLIVSVIVRRITTALFVSYLILLFSIIYFLTLIFFVVERGINHEIHTYPDTLWWAAMTVTTLGSTIQPVSVAGKIITTVLATVGLTIFPIFTAYITTIVNRISQREAEARLGKTN